MIENKPTEQILKSRDDNRPIRLTKDATKGDQSFTIKEGRESSWLKSSDSVGPSELRPRIEPC